MCANPTKQERDIQKLVALMQMTTLGAPMIYYGTEAGMWGADDPDDRMPMVWEEMTYADQEAEPRNRPRNTDAVGFDADIFAFYKAVIALRQRHDVLRYGSQVTALADDEANSFAFTRTWQDNVYVVAMNRSDTAQELDVSGVEALAGKSMAIVFTTKAIGEEPVVADNRLMLPPLAGVVLEVERE